jgi:hypothetical protein
MLLEIYAAPPKNGGIAKLGAPLIDPQQRLLDVLAC